MKNNIIFCFVFVLVSTLVGCSSPHTMMLRDGRLLELADEPEFNKHTGFYEFETTDGKMVRINKNEVIEIKEK